MKVVRVKLTMKVAKKKASDLWDDAVGYNTQFSVTTVVLQRLQSLLQNDVSEVHSARF